jgi:uncharacterized protein
MHQTPRRRAKFEPATWQPDSNLGHVYRRPRRSIQLHSGALIALAVALGMIYGAVMLAQNLRLPSLPESQAGTSVRLIAPGQPGTETGAVQPDTTVAATEPSTNTDGVAPLAETNDAEFPAAVASSALTLDESGVAAAGEDSIASGLSPNVSGKRVWVGGDSMAYAVGLSLLNTLQTYGAVAVHAEPDSHVSSGLLSPDFFDWHAHLADEMERHNPDIAVFMIGMNDATESIAPDDYRVEVARALDLLQAEGRQVIVIGQPVVTEGRPDLLSSLPQINGILATEAAARGMAFVDTWPVLADGNGSFTTHLPDGRGGTVRVRSDDGIHLTSAGSARIASAVLGAIR